MNWLVLKNRRHEGPFAEDALREFVRAGRFKAEDYAITVAQSEKGDFDYVSLRKILGLPEDAVPASPPVAPPRKPVVIPAAPPKPPGQSDRDRTKDLAEWARRVLPADFNIVLPPRRRK
jgi:hypothetical protein